MNRLLVLGAGGHGKVVADAALAGGQWAEVAFLDDRSPALATVLGLCVVGAITALKGLGDRFSHAVVAVGDPRRRLALIDELEHAGYMVGVIVHPRATVSAFARLAPGTVVMAGAIINPDASVGKGGIINTGACVDHDCRLGEAVHICPGVNLAGNVTVGDRTWVGIGSCAKQGVTIGRNVVVGAGATIVSDVGDGLTVVGTPARPLARSAPAD
jgi:sugar O-acyltransferase (sialic acid O-acetyltransferase NeuD family)